MPEETSPPTAEECRAFAAKLRAFGIGSEFSWERAAKPQSGSARERLYESMLACFDKARAEREAARDSDSIAFWLDRLPRDRRWFDFALQLADADRAAFRGCRPSERRPPACLVVVSRSSTPALYEELRELRWQRAAEAAARRGRKLPHLLEGDRFSIDGYNFEVTRIGHEALALTLLDEHGGVAAGTDLFHDIEFEPPVEVSKPLPRGARQRMYLALGLLGDLADHLANKPDPE